jgi:glycosyltransferase involved in cell wall biosynthesis
MRVLHIGKFFPPHPGGIERSCAELSAALAARNVTTAVLAHAEPGARKGRSLEVNGVEVTLAACHGQFLYAPISPTFPWLVARLIRTFRPDLLHLHLPNTSALSCLLSPAARRLPWIVHWHSDIPLDVNRAALRAAYRLYEPWEGALIRRARAVIATSVPYLDSSKVLAPWRDKVRVIPLGIPPAPEIARTAQTSAWRTRGLHVLAVGRLSYYKGFDVLLRALAKVPAAELVLVGQGECESSLRNLARELCINDRVIFAGTVDDAELAKLYACADALCLPSIERSEAFGLVLLEAMRASLPTIASNVRGSGIGYVVRDGETGLLVRPGDVEALAAAMHMLESNQGLRRRLGEAGAQRWRDEFTLDQSAERTLTLYRDVLSEHPDRAASRA